MPGYERLTDVGAWRGHGLAVPAAARLRRRAVRRCVRPRRHRPLARPRRARRHRDRAGDRPAGPLLRRPRRAARARRSGRHERRGAASSTSSTTCSTPASTRRGRSSRPCSAASPTRSRRRGCTSAATRCAPRRVVGITRGPALGGGARRRRDAARSGLRSCARSSRSSGASPAARSACGRRAPARSSPGDGYAVGWTSADACRRLAAAGHDVVAAPGRRLLPRHGGRPPTGTSPARAGPGTRRSPTSRRSTRPPAGPPPSASTLLGVQACLWTEHVHDRPTLERLLFPRLTAIADAAWPGPASGSEPVRAR